MGLASRHQAVAIWAALPSPEVISETRFLTITQAAIQHTGRTDDLTALGYGLDWTLVFFPLAAWSFRRRSLARGAG